MTAIYLLLGLVGILMAARKLLLEGEHVTRWAIGVHFVWMGGGAASLLYEYGIIPAATPLTMLLMYVCLGLCGIQLVYDWERQGQCEADLRHYQGVVRHLEGRYGHEDARAGHVAELGSGRADTDA